MSEGNIKKRPSLIIMKRLDTMGLRILSQLSGAGTRRAGVRLSSHGHLTPHRRGEPITSAPPVNVLGVPAPDADDIEALLAQPTTVKEGVVPDDVRVFALAELQKQIGEKPHVARAATLPALKIEPPPQTSITAWAAAFVTAGIVLGILLAHLVTGGEPLASPQTPRAEVETTAAAPAAPAGEARP